MPAPTELSASLEQLANGLSACSIASLDFETTSLDPTYGQIVGVGVYLPETASAFYINVGHTTAHPSFPRYAKQQVADALLPFLLDASNVLIAHNATFELRYLLQLGLSVRCRVACTMIHSHRVDENLRSKGPDATTHYYSKVSYGLKELTCVYYNETPPTLADITGGKAVAHCDANFVAQYCVLDCYNAYRLYHRAGSRLDLDNLTVLTSDIDDPNIPVLARMMHEGVLIDAARIAKQIPRYVAKIRNCREGIWKAAGVQRAVDTPAQILDLLRHINIGKDLQYDPFWTPMFDYEVDPSVAREVLLGVLAECQDEKKQRIVALIIAKSTMEQRLSSFLRPWSSRANPKDNRLRPGNFTSTLVTTRFTSSPNLQNLPGRADATDDEAWREMLTEDCQESFSTRSIFVAGPGKSLVSMDLSAAEPRYLSLLFQRALTQR